MGLKLEVVEAPRKNITIETDSELSADEQLEAQIEVMEDFVKESLGIEDEPVDSEESKLDKEFVNEASKKELPKDARIFESCRVSLTKEEKAIYNESHLKKLNEKDERQYQFEAEKAAYQADLKTITAEANSLRRVITNGYEYRQIECFERFDYKKGIVRVIRRDTFELVKIRDMTAKERQQSFFTV